jgi:hypothetical protein
MQIQRALQPGILQPRQIFRPSQITHKREAVSVPVVHDRILLEVQSKPTHFRKTYKNYVFLLLDLWKEVY